MRKTVKDIMSDCVITISEEDTLDEIRNQMETHGVRHIPVLDGKKLVGLVSQRDVLRFSSSELHPNRVSQVLEQHRSQETFAAQVMTRKVVTVRPETPLADAAALLVQHRFGCLPVTNEDEVLVGIITSHDLVKTLMELLRAAE